MKKIKFLFLPALLAAIFAACSENPGYEYNAQKDNIYFDYATTDDSKITYSFADTTFDVVENTIYLPVKISGKRVSYDRKFRVEVIDSLTTAKPSLHYEPMASSYTLAADSGTFKLPVVLYNTDEILQDSTLVLALRLVDSDNFSTAFPHLISATISFSSRLEEPSWWKYWLGELGTYSRTKHFLFLISSGTKALTDPTAPDSYLYTPEVLYHISEYKAFLADPFTWVGKHTEYALEKKNGSDDYTFYLKAAPDKTYLLKWEAGNGKYFFIDENNEIIS